MGGGTLIKIMSLQPVYIVAASLVLTIIPITSSIPLRVYLAIYQVMLVFFLVQVINGFDDLNYQIISSQFLYSILYTWIGFCVYIIFRNDHESFTRMYAASMSVLIVYTIFSHLIIYFFNISKIVLVTASNAYYKGLFVFFSERIRTDYLGYDVREIIFGLELPRFHGIFWEPSVFVTYAALLLYVGLYVTRRRLHVFLATIGLLGAQSLTGFVLLIVCYLWLYLRPAANVDLRMSKYRRTGRFLVALILFGSGVTSIGYALLNTEFSTDKIGSISQRFYDTAGAFYTIAANPAFGVGLNMDSYDLEIENLNIIDSIDANISTFSLNEKDEIKYSNSVLRLFVKVGIPFGCLFLFGLYRQTLFDSRHKVLLFVLILLGSSAAPILEMSFLFSLVISGLVHSRN